MQRLRGTDLQAHRPFAEAGLALRIALVCLVAHAALSLFSAFAFSTFLSGPPPAWLQTPENQRMLKLGWTFGPATTVVLGALAGATGVLTATLAFGLSMSVLCLFFATRRTIAELT